MFLLWEQELLPAPSSVPASLVVCRRGEQGSRLRRAGGAVLFHSCPAEVWFLFILEEKTPLPSKGSCPGEEYF